MGEAKRRGGKPAHHTRTRVPARVNAQVGQVAWCYSPALAEMAGVSDKRNKELEEIVDSGPESWAWFVWPEDLNSAQAIMAETLLGPYPNQAAAEEAAASIWWEKQ